MILDDNLILIESSPIGAITGNHIPLTSLFRPGKHHGPIPMTTMLMDEPAGGSAIILRLQQSDDRTGPFEDVPGAEMTVEIAAITPGVNFGWRVVPLGVSKQWVRLVVEPVGSFTSGRIFSALAREELIPMSRGQYINNGIVQG